VLIAEKHLLVVNATGQIVLFWTAFTGNTTWFYVSLFLIVVPVFIYLSLKDPSQTL
jgi:hypothetical protein